MTTMVTKKETKKEQIGRVVYSALAVVQNNVGYPKGYGGSSHVPGLLELRTPFNSLNGQLGKRNRAKFDEAHKNLDDALNAQKELTDILRSIETSFSSVYGPTPTYGSTATLNAIKNELRTAKNGDIGLRHFAVAVEDKFGGFGEKESIGSGNFTFQIDLQIIKSAGNIRGAYDAFEKAPNGDMKMKALYDLGGTKEVSVHLIIESLSELDSRINSAVDKAGKAMYGVSVAILEPLEKKYPYSPPPEIRIHPILGC